MNQSSVSFIVIFIPLILLTFLAFREVLTWYWKLNKISKLLEKIEENTRPKNNSNKETSESKPQQQGSAF